MTLNAAPAPRSTPDTAAEWSLLQLLTPETLSDPYPFFARLRGFEPVHWDLFTHAWVVTSYAECVTALTRFSANRTPSLEQLQRMGLSVLEPYALTMKRQLMFMDAPNHTQLKALCTVAFTPKRVEALRADTVRLAKRLLNEVEGRGTMDVIADFAEPLPALVMSALLGIPAEDAAWLKERTARVTELMGNFGYDPERMRSSVDGLLELLEYFERQVAEQRVRPREGLVRSLIVAEIHGERLSNEEIVCNLLLILAGGFEEATNLLGASVLTLLRQPKSLERLRDDPEVVASGVEELLRFQSPTQHTGRIAPEDTVLGGKKIAKGSTVTLLLAAANRDPLRFAEPERLDLAREDNRHLAFGWGAHYCLGAPLTRMVAQVALPLLLRQLPGLRMVEETPAWRANLGMRGLERLRVAFDTPGAA
jgi:cytochrome P450